MKVLGSYEKARIYIEKLYEDSEEAKFRNRKLNPGPIITISRETGIGAGAICENLTSYLNGKAIDEYNDWTYFDRDLIEKVMEDHNMPDHFRKFLAEEKPPQIDSWFSELIGLTPSKLYLLHKTANTIKKLSSFGNVIIVGRGANLITANFPNTFHIRLVAPIEFRIENAVHLYKFDKKTIADFIKKEDDARKNYILKFFHKDVEDPLNYHVVINTNLYSTSQISAMIGHCVVNRFSSFFDNGN